MVKLAPLDNVLFTAMACVQTQKSMGGLIDNFQQS